MEEHVVGKRAKAKGATGDLGLSAAGFFVLRTPLLPFDALEAWGEGLEAPEAGDDPARLEAALDADKARLRERLGRAALRAEIRDALFVGSPGLVGDLDAWVRDPDSGRGQKVERPLVRYFSRMSARATPFGLFSGCSVGALAAGTRLLLPPREGYRRHTRLDMAYLLMLTDALAEDPAIRGALRYRPSSSLYAAAGRLRYIEGRSHGRARSYHLVAIEPSDHLQATLARAAATAGGATAATLAEALAAADPEVALEEARGFVDQLIEAQVLVPELGPAVTGPEPIHGLIAALHDYGCAGRHQATRSPIIDATALLERARDAIDAIDAGGVGAAPAAYKEVARSLEALPAPVELPRLFQVDLIKPAASATLGPTVIEAMIAALETLRRIAPAPPDGALGRFRDAFVRRFEGQEVPLVLALDEEAGVGYGRSDTPSPLLEGVPLRDRGEVTATYAPRHALLLAKIEEALARGAHEIELTQEDLARLENPEPPDFPASLAVLATVGARSEAAIDAGDFRLYIERTAIPSGAALLGRFCHADPDLRAQVERLLRAEETLVPDAIYAEIVHLPEGRTGNVICRPVLREHEIPFLGRSGTAPEAQIPIMDLLVSVSGREVILRSKARGTRVIPRMSNAHNFSKSSIGMYRFLCELGRQGAPRLAIDWGPLANAPYRPRLVLGRLVLSLETWHIGHEHLARLGEAEGAARFAAVQRLREALGLPRRVAVADRDRVLPVDLGNALSVESFVHLVKGMPSVTLKEIAPGGDELCVRGPEGRFTHELLVPFLARAEAFAGARSSPSRAAGSAAAADVPRAFLPGSEWLYAKIYTGTATCDQVLRALCPIVDGALASGAADLWFYLRYGDPEWHVRLRLHGSPARLAREVLPSLEAAMAPLLADGRIWKVAVDTYVREVERYGGGAGIALAERLFDADSRAALGIVALLDGDAGEDARWRLAFRGIDQLLDDLGLDFASKRRVIRRARARFGAELSLGIPTERALGKRYREERASLHALLDRSGDAASSLAPALALLAARSERVREIAAQLADAARSGVLLAQIDDLAGSYVHMAANRLLRAAARRQELVIYDLLDRCYDSRAARERRVKEDRTAERPG